MTCCGFLALRLSVSVCFFALSGLDLFLNRMVPEKESRAAEYFHFT